MASKFAAVREDTRALVKVVAVDFLTAIKKADFVELAHVGGWQCVVKKDEFKPGDRAMYIEIDSLLPVNRPEFAFLAERNEGLRTIDDVVYSRIRTIKLRGELSQGLLLPLPERFRAEKIGANLTNKLDVRKWEEIILNSNGLDARLNAESKTWHERLIKWIAGKPAPSQFGPWPAQLSKSDQERVQNIGNHFAEAANNGELFEETVKLDGQSMTVFDVDVGDNRLTGVCSRNYQLSLKDIHFTWEQTIRRFLAQNLFALVSGVSGFVRSVKQVYGLVRNKELTPIEGIKEFFSRKFFWFTGPKRMISARDESCVAYTLDNLVLYNLFKWNTTNNERISIQGELVGPGIQGNYEQVEEHQFYVYQVYRNGNQKVLPAEARRITSELGLAYVPLLNPAVPLPNTIKDVLKRATGKGALNPAVKREGIVFKSVDRDFSFKVISNDYLIQKEKALDAEEA